MTYDTLIIGAGAAGLAAARILHDAGYKILILEARNRIGGRIHTDYDFADFPIELGAEFIHGDNAVTHELVKQAGLHTIPVVRMSNLRWSDGKNSILPLSGLPENLRTMLTGLLHDYENLPEANLTQDCSLADYLHGRGWSGEALAAADVLLAQTCCASIETLSCHDLIREMQVDHAGHGEARIQEGHGTWLESYQQNLPIEFNTPVQEIQWGGKEVLISSNGQVYQAKNCIITVPVSVLQSGTIRFTPSLSQEKQWAIHAFRTEPATKLIYHFREKFWDDDLTFMAHAGLTARWWTPGYGRPDAAIICCYITTERARKIDAMSEAEALDTGLTELSTLLGVKTEILRAACLKSKRISWAADPYALGGYAHVAPDMAECRVLLAQPENNQLFFAGEATAFDTNPQTVHGAIESGWRAAKECLMSRVIQKIDPQARLLRAWALKGGVSAEVTALEIERGQPPQKQKMIVRRHGEVDRTDNPNIAADEFKLLQHLKLAGLTVPTAYYFDLSNEILPTPYVVIEYIEGATEFAPANVEDCVRQLATHLAQIHQVDWTPLDFLPRIDQKYTEKLSQRPAKIDDSISERRIRDILEKVWPLPQRNPSVLLHGDFWPGNVLWRDGQVVAVIDWEDAKIGDPLADLGSSRLEILWAFGIEAFHSFTQHYQAMNPIDFTNLPYWDLCAALRPAFKISEWAGGDIEAEKKMRDRHQIFARQAFEKI